jgi:hypothetical protein
MPGERDDALMVDGGGIVPHVTHEAFLAGLPQRSRGTPLRPRVAFLDTLVAALLFLLPTRLTSRLTLAERAVPRRLA